MRRRSLVLLLPALALICVGVYEFKVSIQGFRQALHPYVSTDGSFLNVLPHVLQTYISQSVPSGEDLKKRGRDVPFVWDLPGRQNKVRLVSFAPLPRIPRLVPFFQLMEEGFRLSSLSNFGASDQCIHQDTRSCPCM